MQMNFFNLDNADYHAFGFMINPAEKKGKENSERLMWKTRGKKMDYFIKPNKIENTYFILVKSNTNLLDKISSKINKWSI
jgi:hypothetical protein